METEEALSYKRYKAVRVALGLASRTVADCRNETAKSRDAAQVLNVAESEDLLNDAWWALTKSMYSLCTAMTALRLLERKAQ